MFSHKMTINLRVLSDLKGLARHIHVIGSSVFEGQRHYEDSCERGCVLRVPQNMETCFLTICIAGHKPYEINITDSDIVKDVWDMLAPRRNYSPSEYYMAYKGTRLPEDAALRLYGIRNLDTVDIISRTCAEIPHNKAHTPSPPTTGLGTAVRASAPAVSAQYPAGFGTREASTPVYERAKAAINDTKAKAKRGNYNADLPIVAPEAHFQYLEVLYRDIVQSSAFFRSGGSYHLQSTWDGDAAAIDGVANVPDWLSLSQYQMFKSISVGGAKAYMLAHLWESYLMICQCSRSVQILKDDGFCDSSINILVKLEALDVAEITEISLQSVENLKVVVENALIKLLGSTDAIAMSTNLMEFVLMPCASFLDHIGLRDAATNPGDTKSILKFCRTTACLLDLAIVTYTGSHASRFDLEIFGRSLEDIHVVDKEDALRFSCTLKALACLNGIP